MKRVYKFGSKEASRLENTQYEKDVLAVLAKNGKPMLPEDQRSIYGWVDAKALWHVEECGLTVPGYCLVEERSVVEFQGTFVDNEDVVGIEAQGLACNCGQYRNLRVRYNNSLGDTLRLLFDGEV